MSSIRVRLSKPNLSAAVTAVLIFAFFNLAAELIHEQRHRSKSKTLLQLEIDNVNNMMAAVHNLREAPNLVLVGSSVIGVPFWELTGTRYFKPSYIVDQFKNLVGKPNFVALNMATDGAMISDSCLMLTKNFLGKLDPQYVVLGVTPRDFCDGGGRIEDSFQFTTLADMGDFLELNQMYLPTVEKKVSFVWNNLVPMYRYRGFGQGQLSQITQQIVPEKIKSLVTTTELQRLMSRNASSENWSNSITQYAIIYSKLHADGVDQQMNFLKHITALCKRHNVQLLVINMPLSEDNRKLLPYGFYSQFRKDLIEATSANCQFLDVGDSTQFKHLDYFDCAHLNSEGCRKIMEYIRRFICTRDPVRSPELAIKHLR
jgi:hypothetical protein